MTLLNEIIEVAVEGNGDTLSNVDAWRGVSLLEAGVVGDRHITPLGDLGLGESAQHPLSLDQLGGEDVGAFGLGHGGGIYHKPAAGRDPGVTLAGDPLFNGVAVVALGVFAVVQAVLHCFNGLGANLTPPFGPISHGALVDDVTLFRFPHLAARGIHQHGELSPAVSGTLLINRAPELGCGLSHIGQGDSFRLCHNHSFPGLSPNVDASIIPQLWYVVKGNISAQSLEDFNRTTKTLIPCEYCGFLFDRKILGRYGCPNCEGGVA